MIAADARARARGRAGITLTEILIALLILSVGLVSVATLFPLGLLRLRDAARYSRSAYLAQSASADISARNLLSYQSFINSLYYVSATSGLYSPLLQDTPYPGGDWGGAGGSSSPGAYSGPGGLGPPLSSVQAAAGNPKIGSNPSYSTYPSINGPGLPFAYDPLWWYEANVQGFNPNGYEARFGAGIGMLRSDPFDNGVPSAHGLQRINNFTAANFSVVPAVFVSPEDVVWQEPNNPSYYLAFNSVTGAPTTDNVGQVTSPVTPSVGPGPSPVVPDLSISRDALGYPTQANDFHYSWIYTGSLVNSSNQACFDGNVVVFENRPFGISAPSVTPNGPGGTSNLQVYQVDGETVVEAIFGHGGNIATPAGAKAGYAAGAQRTVLLRWYASLPDPVVKVGDWIADITYERSQSVVLSRFWAGTSSLTPPDYPLGVINPTNNGEWDNLPAQRCFWYQVQKVSPAVSDPYLGNTYRSMVVYVNQNLVSRTLLTAAGTPYVLNAALICPSVVNVIPTTIFTR